MWNRGRTKAYNVVKIAVQDPRCSGLTMSEMIPYAAARAPTDQNNSVNNSNSDYEIIKPGSNPRDVEKSEKE